MSSDHKTGLQLRSLIKKSGELEISLLSVPTPEPAEDEVRGSRRGDADQSVRPRASGRRGRYGHRQSPPARKDAPVVTAKVPEAGMRAHGRAAR